MYFDDFIAEQILKTNDSSSSHDVRAQQPIRRLLRTLWRGARQVAWGIDAFSSIRHGIDVPPDHGARSRPRHPATRDLEGPIDGSGVAARIDQDLLTATARPSPSGHKEWREEQLHDQKMS